MKVNLYKLILILFSLITVYNAKSQTNNVGIGTQSPDASAILDLEATDMGLLVPRLTTTERNNINSPATGLLIYNSSENKFQFYNGSSWTDFASGSGSLSLSEGLIFVGNGNDEPKELTISGDATIDTNGVLEIANDSISGENINLTGNSDGDIMYYDGTDWARLPAGLTGTTSDGQILIGDGSGFSLDTLIAGQNVEITRGVGSIEIAAAGGGGGDLDSGTVSNSTLRWNGAWWIENTNFRTNSGNIYLGDNSVEGRLNIFDGSSNSALVEIAGLSSDRTYTIPDAGADASFVMNTSTPGNGQVLIGNGTNFSLDTLTAGSNITITRGAGTIEIAASGGGGGDTLADGTTTSSTIRWDGSDWIENTLFKTSGAQAQIGDNSNAGELQIFDGSNNSASLQISSLASDRTYTIPDAGADASFVMNTSTPGNGQVLIGNGTNFSLDTLTAGSNITITHGAGTIEIAAAGSDGISDGTVNNSTLRWNGTDWVENTGIRTSNQNLLIGDNSNSGTIQLFDGSSNNISLQSPALNADYTLTLPDNDGADGDALVSDGNGNLSWDSTLKEPAWKLSGNSGITSNDFIGTLGTQDLQLRTNNLTRLIIASNGRVGIGTSFPTGALDVEGSGDITRKFFLPADSTEPADGDLANLQWTMWVNGTNDRFEMKAKKSGGTVIKTSIPRILKTTITQDVGNIPRGDILDVDFNVTGAETGASVVVSNSADLPDGAAIAGARVSATNTVTVRFINVDNQDKNPASMDYYITIFK